MPGHHRQRRAGTTLVELLLAIFISALIMTMVLVAYQSTSGFSLLQSNKSKQRVLARDTLQLFSRELQQLFVAPQDTACVIELENNPTSLVRLAFCRWTIAAHDAELPTQALERVTFLYSPGAGPRELLYVTESLTGPAAQRPPLTNSPGAVWPRMLVHLHDGQQWQTNWTSETRGSPAAARIQLLNEKNDVFIEDVVLIPSGLVVTSRIARTAVAGTAL
jgi:type II secretory pathway component PulJ